MASPSARRTKAILAQLRELLQSIPLAAWLGVPVFLAVFSLTQAAVARAFGVTVHQVRLGFGPRLARLPLAGISIEIGGLPLGSAVQMATHHDDDRVDGTCCEDLSAGRQALLQLSGPLSLLALAGGLVALWPPLSGICGVLAVANLLPLHGTAGGQLLLLGLGLRGRALPPVVLLLWTLLGTLGVLGGLVFLLGMPGAHAQACLERAQVSEPARAVLDRAQIPEAEILARLTYAEAISTGFPDEAAVYRAIAWGTMSRVRLAARSPAAARRYGQGIQGVVFQPGQFNPAISPRSPFGALFLCPSPGPRWTWAQQAATAALAGQDNPFLQTPWEREHGLSLVVNFYYPASVQARSPLAPWEDSPQLVFLTDAPVPASQVRFYRLTQPPSDIQPEPLPPAAQP